MISLQNIRTAIFDAQPFTQMDRLIQDELSSGRKVKEILDALKPLVDDILETPDLSDDGEEAFLGTLDALMGNCRKEQCYIDRPITEVSVPALPASPKSTPPIVRTV